jgi:hypothetical protein
MLCDLSTVHGMNNITLNKYHSLVIRPHMRARARTPHPVNIAIDSTSNCRHACLLLNTRRILTINLVSHEHIVLYSIVYCYINTTSGTTQGIPLNKTLAPDINTAVRTPYNSSLALHV